MSMNKNLLATAVAGALYLVATSAAAQVKIDGTAADAVVYASELTKPTDGTGLGLTGVAANQMQFSLGYNFSANEVRYARVECSSNLRFTTPATPTITEGTTGTGSGGTAGAVNGSNTSVITFSITAPNAATLTSDDVVTISSGYRLFDANNVTCSYSLYDTPSQAAAGGTGQIVSKSDTFLRSASAYAFTTTPGTATANVEATGGAYTAFVGSNEIGKFTLDLSNAGALKANGTPLTLAELLASTTAIRVTGKNGVDFSAGNIELCGDADGQLNTAKTASTIEIGDVARTDQGICWLPNTASSVIPEGEFEITLVPVAETGYTLSTTTRDLGKIVRNGTELQAPLANVPPTDYVSRIALTNTGKVARAFSIKVLSETGGTISTGTTGGTIPAEGSIVVDLKSVMTGFAGQPPRGTLIVTVAGPDKQIQGQYQIVRADTGAISNMVMVRPGTN